MFMKKRTETETPPTQPQDDEGAATIALQPRFEQAAERRGDEGEPDTPAAMSEPSVLSRGVVLKGTIVAPGPLHFQGHIEGEVEAPQVSLGSHGTVTGRITCGDLTLDGFVDGEIVCKEVNAGASARIKGVIECESIHLELGATINGEVRIGRR